MSAELMRYVGPSMNPTLAVGDGLKVVPYDGREVRVADVIVFPHPQRKYNVVHRVVRIDQTGIRTRGDNNNEDDPWCLRPEQVLGKVVSVGAGERTRTIPAGARGCAEATAIRGWNRVRKWTRFRVAHFLYPIYDGLAKSGLLRRCLGKRLTVRVVSYARPTGVELALFLGNRHVGKLEAGAEQWRIRAPWRLFVDETALPAGQIRPDCCADGKQSFACFRRSFQ
jgi:signal peptidase I